MGLLNAWFRFIVERSKVMQLLFKKRIAQVVAGKSWPYYTSISPHQMISVTSNIFTVYNSKRTKTHTITYQSNKYNKRQDKKDKLFPCSMYTSPASPAWSTPLSHIICNFVFGRLETSGGLSYPVAHFALITSNIVNTVKKITVVAFLIQSQAILVNNFFGYHLPARPPAGTWQVFWEEKNYVI